MIKRLLIHCDKTNRTVPFTKMKEKHAGWVFCCATSDISIYFIVLFLFFLSCCRINVSNSVFCYFLALDGSWFGLPYHFINFNAFYPGSMELFLMQCTYNDLSFVESFTAWYWVSSYLQIGKKVYLRHGKVLDISVPCWCCVQFANWKIMRAIMAYHSLKFICWAFCFSSVLSMN